MGENEKKKIENKFVNGTQRLENEMNIKKKVIENYVENEEKNIDNKFVNKSNELNNNLIFVQTTLTKNREELKALSAEQNEKDKEDDYGDVRILGEESKERTKAINQMQILGAKIKSDEEKETKIKEELLALEQSKDQKLEELEKDKEEKLAELEKEKKKEFAALKQRKQEKLAELEKEKKNLTEASKKLGTNQTITEALDASRELLSKVSDDQLEYAILKNSDLSSNSVRSQIVGNIATLGISKNDKMFKKWAISFILKKDNSSNDFNRFIIEKFMFAIDFTFFHIGLFFLKFLPLQKILDSFKGE